MNTTTPPIATGEATHTSEALIELRANAPGEHGTNLEQTDLYLDTSVQSEHANAGDGGISFRNTRTRRQDYKLARAEHQRGDLYLPLAKAHCWSPDRGGVSQSGWGVVVL